MKKVPKFYTITGAAKRLKISRQAVHDAIKKGLLSAERGEIIQTVKTVGWKISPSSVEKYKVDKPRRRAGKKSLVDA